MRFLIAAGALAACAGAADAQVTARDARMGPLMPSVKIEGAQLTSLTAAKFSAQAPAAGGEGTARMKGATAVTLTLTLAKGPDKTMETWFGGDRAPRNIEVAFLDR